MENSCIREGYRLVNGQPPSVAEYLTLRRETGLTPATEAQAILSLKGSWYACHVIHEETDTAVGMGRIIGDGGWYFHIIDMAVLPDHQHRGLGGAVLNALLDRIRNEAPPGAYVNLLADPPGRRLYGRHGFIETAPREVGMAMRLR